MSNIIIPNQEKNQKLQEKIKQEGASKFHILADFDRTLTYAHTKNRKPMPSTISILRDYGYLSKEYQTKAKALFEKYHPIETDPSVPTEKKEKTMEKWWTSHFDLLIKSNLNKKDLEKIVESGITKLRKGVKEIFKHANTHNIPIVIMSSSGIGDTIPMILKKEKILYDNIYIITNTFTFDEQGRATKPNKPIIHALNKKEISIKNLPVYNTIKDRPNIVLLGDSLNDPEMTSNLDSKYILKVGLLNQEQPNTKTLNAYKKTYDIIITKDSGLESISKFIQKIK